MSGMPTVATTRIPTATGPTPAATTTPTAPTQASLTRCIEPVEDEEFLARYWEQRPLVVQRGEPGRFDDLLSRADAERLLSSTALRYPAFRLVRAGDQIDPSSYTKDLGWTPEPFTRVVDVARVAAEFAGGATIVLQALHLSWEPLAVFCRRLESILSHPVQANAYYTPSSAQGLAVHHDTHDVFVLQIAGEKRWKVYEPKLELPLPGQTYEPSMGEPGEPVEDVVLGPGDTMYMPRGWLHEGLTSDSDSLHITIGVKLYTWIDAVRAALEECAGDLEFRRSVDTEPGDLVEILRARLVPEDVDRRRRRKFVKGRRPALGDQLEQIRALGGLGLDTQVERRPTVIFDLYGAALTFEGKTAVFPERVREEIEFVAAVEGPFTPADIPGDLDGEGRLTLVRRLVREGFLRIADEPG
jgi:lysine-specific demethylase/histidyl-hydroxylase NO66